MEKSSHIRVVVYSHLLDVQLTRDSRGEAFVNVEIYSAIYCGCGMKKADKLAALKYADLKMCVRCRCSWIQPCWHSSRLERFWLSRHNLNNLVLQFFWCCNFLVLHFFSEWTWNNITRVIKRSSLSIIFVWAQTPGILVSFLALVGRSFESEPPKPAVAIFNKHIELFS